jgi:hypothetical protein
MATQNKWPKIFPSLADEQKHISDDIEREHINRTDEILEELRP